MLFQRLLYNRRSAVNVYVNCHLEPGCVLCNISDVSKFQLSSSLP